MASYGESLTYEFVDVDCAGVTALLQSVKAALAA